MGTSPTKWMQRPNMIIAVDRDIKHQFKQINNFYGLFNLINHCYIFQDLFTSNWKAGVASVATKRLSSSGSQSGRAENDTS